MMENGSNQLDQNNDNSNNKEDDDSKIDDCLVKMRGLPWSATVEDILSFLSECKIKGEKDGIHLTMSPLGRPSGEAYIELETPEDAAKALKKDHQHMGHRYIEVFPTSRSEMDWVVSRCGMNIDSVMDEGCIRMRGLPYGCTKDEVASFFSGLQIVPNGINFATDYNGRATGEAYVQFVNKENVEKALKKHMEKIGHRYIEIFRSSLAELDSQTGPKMRSSVSGFGRSAPYDRNERFGGPNRFGAGGGPAPPMSRMSRYRNDGDWDDYGDSGFYGGGGGGGGGPASRMKPPMRGGFDAADDSEYGPRHVVHMRGLPYRASEDDIASFFRPLEPVDVRIVYDKTDRPSGEAIVEFGSHEEAVEAMSKDKEHMQSRYIELFLDSVPDYKNEFSRPSAEFSRPSADFSRPSADFSRPSADFSRPSADFSRPSADFSRPSADFSRPSADFSRPSADFSRPSADFSRPSADFSRPNADFSRPSADFSRPSADFGRPSAAAGGGGGGLGYRPPSLARPRGAVGAGGGFAGGRGIDRPRVGGPPFGTNSRPGQGTKPFMSSGGTGFRSAW